MRHKIHSSRKCATVAAIAVILAVFDDIVYAGEVGFTVKPSAIRTRDGKVEITFAVSAPTDVEVAVLASDGKVVRHLGVGC